MENAPLTGRPNGVEAFDLIRVAKRPVVAIGILALVAIAVRLTPTTPFIIDGGIYADMARAMAEGGALSIADNGGVAPAPALTKYLTVPRDGLVYPQYPSGYALLAAPFYLLFGVHGLILLNVIAALVAVFLTWRIGARTFGATEGALAAALLAGATFMHNYAFAIWPHMLALALWLGALDAGLRAGAARSVRRAAFISAFSGFLIGIGINIRIDVVLAAPAVLIWLKLFARPSDRWSPLAFVAGMTPGLLLAAAFNDAKFGDFSPFSYGPKDNGLDSMDAYGLLPWIALLGLAALFVVNIPRALDRLAPGWGNAAKKPLTLTAIAVAAVGAASVLSPFIADALYGVYVLVVNLGAYDSVHIQQGVEKDAFGHLLFWGFPKRALLQSLPFLPLALVVFCRRDLSTVPRAAWLFLISALAPIGFYALNQWHGGGSYNMRYFLSALPCIAVLSAAAIVDFYRKLGGPSRQFTLASLLAGVVIYFGAAQTSEMVAALKAPAALYPQWILAGLLTAALLTFGAVGHDPDRRSTAAVRAGGAVWALAFAAIGCAGLVNVFDLASTLKARGEAARHSRLIATHIPEGALVLTSLPVLTMEAERKGAYAMAVADENAAQAAAAGIAFVEAGRCVYVQTPYVRQLLSGAARLPGLSSAPVTLTESENPEVVERLTFFTLSREGQACQLRD